MPIGDVGRWRGLEIGVGGVSARRVSGARESGEPTRLA